MVDLASRLAGHATATALIEGDDRISYGELSDRVLRTAAGLRSADLGPDGRVAIAAGSTIDGIVSYLGVQAAGFVPVMLSPRSPDAEFVKRLEQVGATLVMLGDHEVSIPSGLHTRRPAGSRFDDAEPIEGDAIEAAAVSNDDVAVVLYTSGVSGLPRPIVLTYGNLAATRDGLVASPGVGLDQRTVAYGGLPIAHVFGLNSIVGSVLRAGGKLVLSNRFDPHEVTELVARHRITALSAVPLMWKALAGVGDAQSFATVTRPTYAVAPMPPAVAAAVADKLGMHVAGGFGLTETAGTISQDNPLAPKPGSVGLALGHTEIRLVDTDGIDALPGDFGEIWLRGPSIALGYLDGTPLERTDEGWFRTGDIGVFDEQGRMSIVDRQKDVINVSGFNVSPAEVEEALGLHAAVATSVVVGEADSDNEMVVAHVVPAPGMTIVESDLIEHCKDRLSRYKVPSRIYVHSELPVTESGKAVRRLLGRS